MAESRAELEQRLRDAVMPGVQGRLLDRGLARGLIWRDGLLPEGAPQFANGLTEDLLDFGHSVMALAMRVRSLSGDQALLGRAFLVAGEAIESAVHRGQQNPQRGFHRVTAAIAFHLGGFAARAYSMLPSGAASLNLAPTELVLVHLLRRRLDDLHQTVSGWLLNPAHFDENIASRLTHDAEFGDNDAIHEALTGSFMRGLSWFDHALITGNSESAERSRRTLLGTAEVARDLSAVSHWWTATMASHLVDELWGLSLHKRLPQLPPEDRDADRWRILRRSFIERLRANKRAAIELWPSQLTAAIRSLDPADDLVVAMPTSAGKTRIAELCILRAVASRRRVVYVTPLRALSAQIERDLSEALLPLGISVSSLYGAAGVECGDHEAIRDGQVVVSTPEKLDFALRGDPSILDDVGLIILDEGHMIGPNEREVRYEALVQRIVRRGDAASRRVVCLSALFPDPAQMADLVAWLRMDEPGEPIHSTWRPTRQRFGVLKWVAGAARLDVKVEEESPFVPQFITQAAPPAGSKRKRLFPSDKNELTLAAAWQFVEQKKEVLIYCALRSSVETLGRLAMKCIEHGVLVPFGTANERIRDAMSVGAEWLGSEHPAVACLQHGVALHHGGLPRPFLSQVERLLRAGDCPVVVASPTLAQGLNLAASVLIVPSIWRNKEIVPAVEFANVAGRAGRAFVDVEGLVLHVIWEDSSTRTANAVRVWDSLVAAAKAPRVLSGILQVAALLCRRIAKMNGLSLAEVVEYVTGHRAGWDFNARLISAEEFDAKVWERDLASMDGAILALLEGDTPDDQIAAALDAALTGSLFSRQLGHQKIEVQQLVRAFITARAQRIWSLSSAAHRRGYHAAGIGLSAGQFMDLHQAALIEFLARAEIAITEADAAGAGAAVVGFAELVFQTAPFQAPKPLPPRWREALHAWVSGQPSSSVIALCDGAGVDLIQDALSYRLPWAMEAVRVHGIALGDEIADALTGVVALAVECGTTDVSVMTLIRAGLASRDAAMAAVEATDASFSDVETMRLWLRSDDVARRSAQRNWPTGRSRRAWLQFFEKERQSISGTWRREVQRAPARWTSRPAAGDPVVLELDGKSGIGVYSPEFQPVGALRGELLRDRATVVGARVSSGGDAVDIEFFGPG